VRLAKPAEILALTRSGPNVRPDQAPRSQPASQAARLHYRAAERGLATDIFTERRSGAHVSGRPVLAAARSMS